MLYLLILKRNPISYHCESYQNVQILLGLYEKWKIKCKFEKGIAIILGKVISEVII